MIRSGRQEGWLKQPIEALPTWAEFNGVTFNGIKIGTLPGLEHQGSTVIAERDLHGGTEQPLMVVPRELILSRENIGVLAKADQHLKELLDAVGDFAYVRAVDHCIIRNYLIYSPDDKRVRPNISSHASDHFLPTNT